MAWGSFAEHVHSLRRPRRPAVPRSVHGLPMGGFGVEVVAESSLIGPLEGSRVGYGEVHATFAAGVQVGAYLRQTLLLQPSRKSLPLLGLHTLGVAQCLEALEMVAWLYALHVVVPLPTSDRPAGVEEPAGAQRRVEVGLRAALYSLLGGLGRLVEPEAVL